MNCTLAVLGLAIVAFGAFMLFNNEAMWRFTEWSNSLKGIASERTDAWEQGNGCSGWLLILVGIGFLVFSLTSG